MSGERLRTITPRCLITSGNSDMARLTRFCTSTWAMFRSVPCSNVTVRNVKICNGRVQNDDGINPCNSQDVRITDCFIRSDDDCVALKGLDLDTPDNNVERIVVENSVLWCDRARIFLLGHESRAAFMRDITLRDLDIIHFAMTPFLFEPGEDMHLEDVRVGHTLNPAIGLFIGGQHAPLAAGTHSLMDVTPKVLQLADTE